MDIKYNSDGLIPAIIQDATTKTVLMLGYMNAEAVAKTLETNKVTFFSRSKQRLWTKGEESGNFLSFKSLQNDCDNDTLLIQATPQGSTCHKGTDTCWGGIQYRILWVFIGTRNDHHGTERECFLRNFLCL